VARAAADIRFRDPFQEIRGRDAFERMLRHMFATVAEPRFVVTDHALGIAAGYLRWTFSYGHGSGTRTIEGVSEIAFAPEGLVSAHLDHWDSGMQVYGRLPLLGMAIRAIARRIAAR
jgi:steroid delta-isomerase